MRSTIPLIILPLFLGTTPQARADAGTMAVDPAVDIPLTLAPLTLWVALSLGVGDTPAPADLDLGPRPDGLDGLSPFEVREGPALVSDVLLYGSLVGGLALSTADGWRDGAPGAAALVYAEAFALTGAATEIVKFAVARPRPYTLTEGAEGSEDLASFFSGHTSLVASAAFSTARMVDLTGELSAGQRWAVYGGAGALTAATGAARVAAGKHYISDVVVGAAVGGCIGWLTPQLHQGGAALTVAPLAGPDGERGLAVAGRF